MGFSLGLNLLQGGSFIPIPRSQYPQGGGCICEWLPRWVLNTLAAQGLAGTKRRLCHLAAQLGQGQGTNRKFGRDLRVLAGVWLGLQGRQPSWSGILRAVSGHQLWIPLVHSQKVLGASPTHGLGRAHA